MKKKKKNSSTYRSYFNINIPNSNIPIRNIPIPNLPALFNKEISYY